MVKKSKGRQRIAMEKMANESNLQVTFSKRRSGLFKKASELCTLCDAEIAIIVFSPGRKVFSFGHPNVETILDRFLNNNPPPPYRQNNMQLGENRGNPDVQDLNNNLTRILAHLELEKKKGEELKKIREKTKMEGSWMEDAIEGFDAEQVKEFKDHIENMKKVVANEASKLFQAHAQSHNFYVANANNNVGFGIDGNGNINPNMEMFDQRRMMNMNAFNYNQNVNLPNHPLQLGNNGYGNLPDGFVHDYNNMNNQNQNMIFKRENISDYENYHGFYSQSGEGPSGEGPSGSGPSGSGPSGPTPFELGPYGSGPGSFDPEPFGSGHGPSGGRPSAPGPSGYN
ncbi:unnamed protein product [Cochlearia groenlandica]